MNSIVLVATCKLLRRWQAAQVRYLVPGFYSMRTAACRLLPVFLVLVAARLCAQNAAFEKITIEQGLSQGMIFDMLQTRDGFLWVATKDGLNRYDGYNFKVFSHDPYDIFSMGDDNAKGAV